METAVPDSIVCRREIEEYDTNLLACVEGIFDVLGDEGHLVDCRSPSSKAGLLIG